MRLQDDIDFTTLTWVKQELDDTLKQAQQALEAYVEDSSDKSQMRFCASYLHQVQGTLRMVELYGAAMVVEEMERLALGLLDGQIKQADDAYSVLMRGMVQLPDYLERLQSGHRDIPIVLLPLLNDLRACRGEKLLSETALFSPDLGATLPASAAGAKVAVAQSLIAANAGRLRLAFQFGLLKWFKGDDVDGNLTRLIAILDRVRTMCVQIDARRLFWVGAAALEGVLFKGLDASVALKLLIGRVDRELKRLIDAGESAFSSAPPNDLTKGLLYYVAQSKVASQRVAELRQVYKLDKLMPSEAELAHARGALSGHNRALLETVGTAIKEDLLRVKDALDLYLRTGSANVDDLAPQGEALHRVADTLGMLGLGVPRRVVLDQQDVLERIVRGRQPAEESALLDIAGSLLYVESSLDDHIERLGADNREAAPPSTGFELPQAEVRKILDATTKEASANIQQAKQDIVAFIESPWDHSKIEQLPRLLDEISGALRMLNLPEPAALLGGVVRFAEVELLRHRRVPSGDQLDLMADAIASIEFFLEAVKEGRRNRDKILDVTRRSLEALGYWPLPVEGSEDLSVAIIPEPIIAEPVVPAVSEYPSFSEDFTVERTQPPISEPTTYVVAVDLPDVGPVGEDHAVDALIASFTSTNDDFDSILSADHFLSELDDAAQLRTAVEIAPGDNLDALVVGELADTPSVSSIHDLDDLRITHADIEAPESLSADLTSTFIELTPMTFDDDVAEPSGTASLETLVDLLPESVEFELENTSLANDDELSSFFVEPELAPSEELVVVAEFGEPLIEVALAAPEVEPLVETAAPEPVTVDLGVSAPAAVLVPAPQSHPGIHLHDVGFHSVASDEIDDEIREVFVEEVQDELDNLNRQYPAWKKDLGDSEKLKPVRRSFHTLKGSGRLVGALAIGEYAWRIENLLNRVLDKTIQPTPAVLDLLDHAIAALPGMLAALKGEGRADPNIGTIMWVSEQLSSGQEVWLPKSSPAPGVTADVEPASAAGAALIAHTEVTHALSETLESSAAISLDAQTNAVALEQTLPEVTTQNAQTQEEQFELTGNDLLVVEEATRENEGESEAVNLNVAQVENGEVAREDHLQAAEATQASLAPSADIERSPLDVDPMLMEILSSEVESHLGTIRSYLQKAESEGSAPVTEELLRAVHTLNGALSMVDLPVLTRVVAPLEGYLKRLRARGLEPSVDGVAALTEASECIAAVMFALETQSPLPSTSALADRVLALRDDLPAPDHPYHGFGIHVADEGRDDLRGVHSEPEVAVAELRPWYEADEESAVLVELTGVFDASDEQRDVELTPEQPASAGAEADNQTVVLAAADAQSDVVAEFEQLDDLAGVTLHPDQLPDDPAMFLAESVEIGETQNELVGQLDGESPDREQNELVTDTAHAELTVDHQQMAETAPIAEAATQFMGSELEPAGQIKVRDDAVFAEEVIELDFLNAISDEPESVREQGSGETADSGVSAVEPLADTLELAEPGLLAPDLMGSANVPLSEIEGEAFVLGADHEEGAHTAPASAAVLAYRAPTEQSPTIPEADALTSLADLSEAEVESLLVPARESLAIELAQADTDEFEDLFGESFDSDLTSTEPKDEALAATGNPLTSDNKTSTAQLEPFLLFDPQAEASDQIEITPSIDAVESDMAAADEVAQPVVEENTPSELLDFPSADFALSEAEDIHSADENPEVATDSNAHVAVDLSDLWSNEDDTPAEDAATSIDSDTAEEATQSATEIVDLDLVQPESAELLNTAETAAALEDVPIREPIPEVLVEATTDNRGSELAQRGPVDIDPSGPLDLPDMDVELLDIFVEEATDILDHADGMMARLRESPADREPVTSLQRDLHTLKGGARMAGLFPIGDLSHAMESLFEAIVHGEREASRPAIEALEKAFDRLHAFVQRVRARQAIALPEHTIARLDAILEGREDELRVEVVEVSALDVPIVKAELSAPATADALTAEPATPEAQTQVDLAAVPAKKSIPARPGSRSSAQKRTQLDDDEATARSAQHELIRVRADLLDNLVNFAGEVSIYRSRLEAQMGGFRFNLVEFEQTVARLREQLRKLEMETEAQILSRFQRESEQSGNSEFDPLELDRFSTLQQLSRALAESVSDLVSIQNLLDDIARQSETLLLQQSRVSSDLQEGLMRTRMVPFESLVPRLRRILRQTAAELGKKAQLKVEGTQGEMDRTVLERMTAPFEHMLRNSLAHGIETPEARQLSGKSEEGTVSIRVSRDATEVLIQVTDDGSGMNRDAIRRKAIERGLMNKDANLSDRDIFQFVLEAGFSTASSVSKVAGRGVGMDVVGSEVKQLGGSLEIDSEPGLGTRITIRLPFTLAVAQAVMVKLGEAPYAIPMSSITGVTRMPRKEFDRRQEQKQLDMLYGGEVYQIYDLGDLLRSPVSHGIDETQVPLLMSRTGDQRAAVRVTQVIGSKEVVVKSAGLQLSIVPGIFGATIMGDGRVVVILDLAPLVRHGVALRQAPELAAQLELLEPVPEPAPRRQPLIMVVDDSITMRKVTTRVLERSNFDVFTAKDGLDAVELLQDRVPDVILLDIEMPRMDGYEVATYIRNDQRLKHIPIIMITSRTGEKHRQRALEVGVDRYLGKPYQEADLLKNVQDALTAGHANVH